MKLKSTNNRTNLYDSWIYPTSKK